MPQASTTLHEPADRLKTETIDFHRAMVSVMEELEAIDWYAQRVDAASDPNLAAVLAHNRDEEKEHAAMVIEWLRRNDPKFDQHLRTYLFTEGPITGIEVAAEAAETTPSDGSLGIGSLRNEGTGR
jgi:ferritin-like protein